MGKTITVRYPGPGVKRVGITTWHPKLGSLVAGLGFELDEDTARPYLEGGLLARVDADDDRAEAGDTITDENGGTQ